jgi:hypothetical protein
MTSMSSRRLAWSAVISSSAAAADLQTAAGSMHDMEG